MIKIKEKYIKHKEAVDNFVWRNLQIFGKQGVNFFILILCARLLSPYDFGIYNYVLAVIFFLIMFGDFGVSTAVAKSVAEFREVDKDGLRKVLFNALLIVFSCTSLVVLLVILFGEFFLKENYIFILLALPIFFLAPVSSLYDGIFSGLKRFKTLSIVSLSVGFVSIFIVYFLILNYGLLGALISQNIFYLLLVSILFFVYGNLYFEFDGVLIRRLLRYSLLVGLAGIGYFLYTKVDLIMLGYFNYTVETGYYGLVSRLFALSIIFFSIFGHVVAPNHIKLNLLKKFDVLRDKIKLYSLYSLIFGIIISILFFFLIPLIVRVFLPEYDNPVFYSIFFFSLFVIPISVVEASLANGFITPLGYVGILTKIILLGGVLNIVCNLILLHYFGYLGIVFSTVLVHNFINLIKIFYFWRIFKFKA